MMVQIIMMTLLRIVLMMNMTTMAMDIVVSTTITHDEHCDHAFEEQLIILVVALYIVP